jgi:hypothetical protein
LFADLLWAADFRSFVVTMQPFYDNGFCAWLDGLMERSPQVLLGVRVAGGGVSRPI